jgi:hypothetical protein
MSQPYRLAVLLCDTPLPSVQPQHGATYHPIFDALLKASVPEGITYELAPYDVVTEMAYPTEQEMEEMDGVLLTGSGRHGLHGVTIGGQKTHADELAISLQPLPLMRTWNGSIASSTGRVGLSTSVPR